MADALEQTRRFVKRYWGGGASPEEVAGDLRRMAHVSRRGIREGAEAIDTLLAGPPEPGELVHLVAWDGNHPLDTASDEEAADFLKQFATMARNILAETKD
jgi:hypothetical protein